MALPFIAIGIGIGEIVAGLAVVPTAVAVTGVVVTGGLAAGAGYVAYQVYRDQTSSSDSSSLGKSE